MTDGKDGAVVVMSRLDRSPGRDRVFAPSAATQTRARSQRSCDHVGECPTQDVLDRYLAGEPSAEIDVHLEACTRCQAEIERRSADTFLGEWVRAAATEQRPWTCEAELGKLMQSLRAGGRFVFGMNDAGADAHLSDPLPLDPPQAPGDLGTLGPYAVEAEVGRGGMGVVYRARDPRMDRIVALKVFRADQVEDRARRRFLQEVRAAARVEHDHVVRLYGMSDPSDRLPYLAMEYIAGPSLAEELRAQERLSPRASAEVIAQVADGLAAAHAAGLIHRDVKPANILLDPATGRAKIGDFGLARLSSAASDLTREGVVAGTPSYFSPEQARGDDEIDLRADIYSLGVTLYTCLAGEPPFRGAPHLIVQQVLHDEPRPPRALNDAVPRDLETICLKAMEKDPSRRYATATEFAADLRRFLRGEPILARPAGPFERGWRWCRNNRKVAVLGAVVGLLLASLATGAVVSAVWISRERSVAVEQARLAQAQRGLALDGFSALVTGIQDRLDKRPGTLELRRSLLETAREGLSRVARNGDAKSGAAADQWLVVAWKRLGDVDLMLGRTADASTEFARAAALAERLAVLDPKSIPIRRELASAYDRLGDEFTRRYELERSSEPFEKAYRIRRALAEEYPDNLIVRRDVRVSQGKLADARMGKGDIDGAASIYSAMLKEMKEKPVTGKDHDLYLSDLRFVYGRLGLLAVRKFDGPAALEAYNESLAQAEALRASDPNNRTWHHEYAVSLELFGAACLQFRNWSEADKAFRSLVALRRKQADADPSDLAARRALALAHQHVGDLRSRRREFDLAKDAYLEALKILDELARRDPNSVMACKDRLLIRRKLGDSEASAERFDEAAQWADQELEILTAKHVPTFAGQAGWISEARLLRDLRKGAPRAVDDPVFIKAQPIDRRSLFLKIRALVLARRGRHEEAERAIEEVLALPHDPTAPVIAARAYALAVCTLPDDRADLRDRYTRAMVDAFRDGVRLNPSIAASFRYEPDFDGVQDHPRFLALTGVAPNPSR